MSDNSVIVLIGYMGCGKSSVGKKLSQKLNVKFLDLDSVIEKKYSKSISQIFNDLGEIKFRSIENSELNSVLSNYKNCVLSLGGGTPCYHDNMRLILSYTTNVFFIDVNSEILSERLFKKKEKRPLISSIDTIEEMKQFINKHYFERRQFYSMATHSITSNRNDSENVVKEILSLLN
ncbi:MAG: shikimate kinase [Flavobacteriaceae bacterium]|nr:MAG: shikimate kinase [Flavobacteriales bacterium]